MMMFAVINKESVEKVVAKTESIPVLGMTCVATANDITIRVLPTNKGHFVPYDSDIKKAFDDLGEIPADWIERLIIQL